MTSRLVVNADDLGLTRSINEGIFQALDAGDITDVSVLANGTAWDHALEGLRQRGIEGVGIHCTLVDGETPISPPESLGPLVNGSERFPVGARPLQLFRDCLLRRAAVVAAAGRELRAQIQRVREAGLRITHLDSHQHTHLFPGLSRLCVELCVEFGIPAIRIPKAGVGSATGIALGALAQRAREHALRNGIQPVTALGYDLTGSVTREGLRELLQEGGDYRMAEIIVHPGFADDYTRTRYGHWRCTDWEGELEAIRGLRAEAEALKLPLVSFAELLPRVQSMACPECGSERRRLIYALSDYSVVRCGDCGLLYNREFLNTPGEETFSADYYLDVQSEGFAHIFDPEKPDPSAPIYEAGLRVVEQRRAEKGRVLDVGCAFGAFLQLARGRGWDVAGVELSPYSSKWTREEAGIEVFNGPLTESSYEPESFDLVTFWDVLEHVPDVAANLEHAAGLLRPGGYLILTTDNYRSLIAYLGQLSYYATARHLTYGLERFYIPYNSCYFTRSDMDRMLRNSGFRIIHDQGIDHPIERINLSPAERVVLQTLYTTGDLLRLNSQFLLVAEKA